MKSVSDTHIEIERKWIVSGWPDEALTVTEEYTMRQGYISVHPAVRIREEQPAGSVPAYILCFKSAGKLARKEIEIPIPQETFRELEELIALPLIPKQRRTYLLPDGLLLEVNHVDASAETAFWYAEVEFSSIEEAERWHPGGLLSEYLSQEVTGKKGFSMGAYWEKTRLP